MKALLLSVALAGMAWSDPGKTLLDYQSELQLSQAQSAQLKTDLTFFVSHSNELRQQLQQAEKLVSQQTASQAPLPQLQSSVEHAEDLRTQLRFQDVTTSRKVRTLLTPEQWERWQQIKRKNSGGKTP